MKSIIKEIRMIKFESKRKKIIFWRNINGFNFYFLQSEVTLYGLEVDHNKSLVLEYNGEFYHIGNSPKQIIDNEKRITEQYVSNYIASVWGVT